MEQKKILFCHTGMSTFVKTDYELLAENFKVIPYHYIIGANVFSKVSNVFKSLYISLKWVWRVDVVYVWFGGYHGFFPVLFAKLLSKKSIIIVGGYDASYVPSIHYGVFYNKGFLLWCIKRVYTWATYVCPVDESLVKSTNYYADPSGMGYPTGILNHMKLDESKIKVIPTGYDGNKFCRNEAFSRKENLLISVGYIDNELDFKLKGFDLIFEIAKILPNFNFILVGFSYDFMKVMEYQKSSNVSLHSKVGQGELIRYLNHSKVFLQLSLTEGLPNALCESMLCECIPIGSNVNGIPKAIGDTGFILKEKNLEKLRELIQHAMGLDDNYGSKARERICKMFPLTKRIATLKAIIEN